MLNRISATLANHRVLLVALFAITLIMLVQPAGALADDDNNNNFFGFGGGFGNLFGFGNPFSGFGNFGGDSGAAVAIVFAVIQIVLAIIGLSRGNGD